MRETKLKFENSLKTDSRTDSISSLTFDLNLYFIDEYLHAALVDRVPGIQTNDVFVQ